MTGKMMHCRSDQEICNFFLTKSKNVEESNIYEAKVWLLTGRSMIPHNFQIQFESYLLEKRQRNVEGCARCFEALFHAFPKDVTDEVNQMTNAVKAVTLTTVKETEDEIFLDKVFKSLSSGMQMEVFMHRTENTPIILEKCQSVLLMVKLFPNLVEQHGGNMLYTLSGCEHDVNSPVRSHLVTELVPSVLRLCKNLESSPALLVLLNQCIEYYVLVGDVQDENSSEISKDGRWEKLYDIIDQVGVLLNWKIVPFFRDADSSAAAVIGLDALFDGLKRAIQRSRNHYHYTELAYIAVILFLHCITSYYEKISSFTNLKTGEKSKLTLVEVFIPKIALSTPPLRDTSPALNETIITTVSPCYTVDSESSNLLQNFITAAKIWEIIQNSAGDRIKNEFFSILSAMTSLNFETWSVYQEFEFDYKTYVGGHTTLNGNAAIRARKSALRMASMSCSLENYKDAAEYAIKLINDLSHPPETILSPTTPLADYTKGFTNKTRNLSGSGIGVVSASGNGNRAVNFSFYNCPSYSTNNEGYTCRERRVHFISENNAEILTYACNILIYCLRGALQKRDDDNCIGHLMTLLQVEWYSPIADFLLTGLFDIIRRNRKFKYYPNFSEFIVECDILEHFMALSSDPNCPVTLEIFTANSNGNVSNSRRMGTRGVERGAKNDMKTFMKKQFLKTRQEKLDAIIIKFINVNKSDIINCF